MILALSTDDQTLLVFPSEAEAISYYEGIDVEDGVWQFYDENGESLDAVFLKPNKRWWFSVTSGTYTLRPSERRSKRLVEQLDKIAAVEGEPSLSTVAEVEKLLTSHSRGTL